MSTASSRPSLPQPAPKHNIRDQLISAGYRMNRQVPSFFGGTANNPFFGGQSQQQRLQQPIQFRSNSPNFPSTNTVIARVSELENKQQINQPESQNNSTVGQPQPGQQYPMRDIALSIRQNAPPTMPPNAGQLSPRSTVFRTKPIIILDQQEKVVPQQQPPSMRQSTTQPMGQHYTPNEAKELEPKGQKMTTAAVNQAKKSSSHSHQPQLNNRIKVILKKHILNIAFII
jgi:hypothetical protein